MDYDTNSLMVTIWSGDTKGQGNHLLNNTSHDFSWVYKDNLTVDGVELKLLTKPYLRLAHFQRSIVIEYFDKNYYKSVFGNTKFKCLELYADISREWKRPEWNELKVLLKSKYDGLVDNDSFNISFENKFEESNRSYAHVSFGYESTIYIPLDVINKYEKSIHKSNDTLAMFISDIIFEHISHIE